MKKLIFAIALVASITAFGQRAKSAAPPEPASPVPVLSRVEVDDLLKTPDQVLIIDVRRPDEIAQLGGFPTYLSIQIDALESSLAWIPRERTLIAVSNHAGRAKKAAQILAAHGYKVAGAVGAELYQKDGGTLAHIVAPAAGEPAAGSKGTAP